MIPEDHKSNLITSGIQFMRAISEAYGSEKGMELWDTIATTIDPELKGQIFFALLTGDFEASITIIGMQPINGQMLLINAIKEVRSVTGWGLKESKDFVEMVRDGKHGTIPCDPNNRRQIITMLRSTGLIVQ